MKKGILAAIKKALQGDSSLHPVDKRLARHYIKGRLALTFPELRNDPRALDNAYRALSIEPSEGAEIGDPEASYELRSHE